MYWAMSCCNISVVYRPGTYVMFHVHWLDVLEQIFYPRDAS